MRVDTSAWKEFRIGDLFEPYKGTRLTKANMIEGDIRFVSAANVNNGVTAHIGNNERIHSEGTISVCYNGNGGTGKAFYQDKPYWASDDVHVLYPKFHLPKSFGDVEWTGLNATIGLFLAAAIEKVGRQKYGFTDKWKLEYMREDKIKLPMKEDGTPNWKWINSSMTGILDSARDSLAVLQDIKSESNSIPVSSWRSFKVRDLFLTEINGNKVQVPTGSWISAKKLSEGETPRITVKGFDNGVSGYYSDIDDANYRVYSNFISASFLGTVFYHEGKASLDMKVHCLKPLNIELNRYIASFLVTSIRVAIDYFKYQDQLSSTVLPEVEIALPVDDSGNPDWDYMESFMRDVMEQAKSTLDALSTVLSK